MNGSLACLVLLNGDFCSGGGDVELSNLAFVRDADLELLLCI